MARRPDIGYFENDLDLLDPGTWNDARGELGKAQTINPLVYSSLTFAYLEDEAIWTRDWICIGTTDDIPNAGDILPYTVGNHGIHVQRMADGSLEGRFNNAQHGGCRFVPVQCQNGTKTKCSFTSCGYSRDRDAIAASQGGQPVPTMHQYTGLRPERLLKVSVATRQSLIFVNIDGPDHQFAPETGLDKQIEQAFTNHPVRIEKEWSEFECNWKLFAETLLLKLNAVPDTGLMTESGSFIGKIQSKPEADRGFSGTVVWSYPNMVHIRTGHVSCWIVLQQTALEKMMCRAQFYSDPVCAQSPDELSMLKAALGTIGEAAKTRQNNLAAAPAAMLQCAPTSHWSQTSLIDRVLNMPRNELADPMYQPVRNYLI
jgi:hypothetical protein